MGYMIKERSLRKTINVVYNVSLSLLGFILEIIMFFVNSLRMISAKYK